MHLKRYCRNVHRFYSNLYRKPAHPDAWNTGLLGKFLKHVPGDRISLAHHNLLTKDFTKQEFFESLKIMKKRVRHQEKDGFHSIIFIWNFGTWLEIWFPIH